MTIEVTVYLMVLLFATVMAFNLAGYSVLRKAVPAAQSFSLIASGIGVWTFFYMFEVINRQLETKLLFFSLKYIGVVILPVSFLFFVLAYTGRDLRRYKRYWPLVLIMPAATLGVLWTNSLHGWFFWFPHLQVQYTFNVLIYTPKFWFYLNSVYSLVMILVCVGILIHHYPKVGAYRKWQIKILLGSMVLPLTLAMIMLTGVRHTPRLDFIVIAFSTSLPILSLGVFRYRLLDIVPEARGLVIESMEDSVIVLDRSQRILDMNPSAQKVFKVTLDDRVGKPFSDIFSEWVEIFEQLDLESRFNTEIELKDDFSNSWFELRTWPLQNWYGSRAGQLVLLRDITQARLLQKNLHLAKESAEQADQAKSNFLANMSHELRTPLNAVVGMTSLLLNMPLTGEQKCYVDTIRTSSNSLLGIINEILDYSKIEAGRMELEHRPFNVQTCMEEALEMVTPQAYAKNIELNIRMEDGGPLWVVGDVIRLRQVLLNLLSNAVKFTGQGQVWLTANKSKHTNSNLELAFSVQDTGIGIPADKIEQIFEMFTQVDTGITRHFGGTGLGLAISRRLVGMMGGRIWVESQPGKGSIFHFTITVQPFEHPEAASHLISAGQFSGKRILVAVGVQTDFTALARMAQHWGMDFVSARTGAQALVCLENDPRFDAILLGTQLPDIGAVEIAQRIQAIEKTAAIPIIMLRTFGAHTDTINRKPFAAVLNKPVKPSQLESVLRVIFQSIEHDGQLVPQLAHSIGDERFASEYPLRILVAEDHLVNQIVILRFLERLGYHATTVANGIEALEALHRQPFDVIFMDVQMPEMDGLEATRQIRTQIPVDHQPHIIGLTAYGWSTDDNQCLTVGMDDYLIKPVSFEDFMAAMNRSVWPGSSASEKYHWSSPEPPMPPVSSILKQLGEDRGEIIELFLLETRRTIVELETAFHQGDWASVQEIVHKLKTSSGYLSATELFRLCWLTETEVSQGRKVGEEIINQMRTLFEQLEAEYRT